MEDLSNRFLELRKEIRIEYERVSKKFYEATLELDKFLEYIQDSLNKEVKGGKNKDE